LVTHASDFNQILQARFERVCAFSEPVTLRAKSDCAGSHRLTIKPAVLIHFLNHTELLLGREVLVGATHFNSKVSTRIDAIHAVSTHSNIIVNNVSEVRVN
jgi:hypothetical protein